MELEGRVRKSRTSRFWLAEVAVLDVMTQGTSREDAQDMILDAVWELLKDEFPEQLESDFELTLTPLKESLFGIKATDNHLLLALALKRQRERSGATVREVAERMSARSPNAYAQYERGKVHPTLKKFDELFHAVNPDQRTLLRVV